MPITGIFEPGPTYYITATNAFTAYPTSTEATYAESFVEPGRFISPEVWRDIQADEQHRLFLGVFLTHIQRKFPNAAIDVYYSRDPNEGSSARIIKVDATFENFDGRMGAWRSLAELAENTWFDITGHQQRPPYSILLW